jgi:hypothetical protein
MKKLSFLPLAQRASRCTWLLFFAAVLAAPIAAQNNSNAGETRIALVIGNGAYLNAPLKNPVNDAKDMAAALRNLGFSVTLLVDGDYVAMNRAIREFGNAIKRQDAVAFFYFSGHGVQYRGANYLIPARADVQNADELPYSAVNADQVYEKMESAGAKTNLIVLDACRNNPFPGAERALDRGLAVVGNVQPPRSLIVYSTAPGKTAQDGEGRNGVFTTALLKHLADPGLDAQLMIRRVREDVIASTAGAQVPWDNSSITGEGFFFAGRGEIDVITDPSGAEISLNGERRGLSPIQLTDVPRFGDVEVTARLNNRSASRRLSLRDVALIRLDLKLETELGSLAIKANEAKYSLLLDGVTMTASPSGVLEGLGVGSHSLEVRGDSSIYRGSVSVVSGKITVVEVALVPCGSITLNLPENVVCKIEGMGIADTSARKDYGQVPVGDYRITVTGGDYESYAETITVKRAQAYQFTPRLRFTTAYLSAKYSAQLDALALTEKRSYVDQLDIDQVAAFQKSVTDEGRSELQPLLDRAEELKARLASVLARQASPAQGAGTAMPAQGPKELYLAYSTEYSGFSSLEKGAALTQGDMDKVAAFVLKALAQPYEDFQELGKQAGELKAKLVVLKAAQDRKTQFDTLVAKQAETTKKYKNAVATGKTMSTIGWWCIVPGSACVITSAVFIVLAAYVAPQYYAATTMKDATTLGYQLYNDQTAGITTGAVGLVLDGLGALFFTGRPNPKPLQEAIDRLDQEIASYGDSK